MLYIFIYSGSFQSVFSEPGYDTDNKSDTYVDNMNMRFCFSVRASMYFYTYMYVHVRVRIYIYTRIHTHIYMLYAHC